MLDHSIGEVCPTLEWRSPKRSFAQAVIGYCIEFPATRLLMNRNLRQIVAYSNSLWLLRTSLIVFPLLFANAQLANAAQNCEGKSLTTEGYEVVCSATWSLVSECDGNDMWARWKISGRTTSPDSFIRPWADTPIKVVGYELVRDRRTRKENLPQEAGELLNSTD